MGDAVCVSGSARRFGTDQRWLAPFPRLEGAEPHSSSHRGCRLAADRHYAWLILFHRYPHGIRGVAGFAYGMSRLPWSTFLAFNFIAAGLWSGVVLSAGFAFGRLSEKLMNDASAGLGAVMLLVFLLLSWILSRKLERIAERA